jgi:uncharacterized protein (DUF1330 family)
MHRMAITPTREQFSAFAQDPREGEIVMINLLHFAAADEGPEPSGQGAYRDYGDQVVKMVEARGGRVLWTGQPEHVLIGDPEHDGWDLVVLVSYPSRAAFIDMVSSPNYQEAHTHRERGLDRSVLLACQPLVNMVGTDA